MPYRTVLMGILLLAWIHCAIAADAKALTAVFDAYNAAVKSAKADKLEPALALRTEE